MKLSISLKKDNEIIDNLEKREDELRHVFGAGYQGSLQDRNQNEGGFIGTFFQMPPKTGYNEIT
jgi:hypothetical protein